MNNSQNSGGTFVNPFTQRNNNQFSGNTGGGAQPSNPFLKPGNANFNSGGGNAPNYSHAPGATGGFTLGNNNKK